ncbi:MAG TPA: ABC transporter substrate-binding protein [Candidatus Limnocylindria bacterium]|nr:ABC transporter substrate-binding protein [Candidatus Limnocylindria bacterium]
MRIGVVLGAVVVALAAGSVRAARSEAATVAHELNASLLDVMKNAKTLGYAGRAERIGPIVDRSFDVPFMAEKVIGLHWKTLDEAERTRWVALFRDFLIANYAGRFDDYSGQTFEDLGEEPSAFDTVVVRTRLLNAPQENVDLNYRMHETPDGWRVVDVILKGTVSELALRRSDYTAVIERDGFAALETYLREKIAALQAGKGEPIGSAAP